MIPAPTRTPAPIDRRGHRARPSSLVNFRDLGGRPARAGQRIAPGLLYRSDALSRADAADRAMLRDAGVRTVVDLRTTREVERHGRLTVLDGPLAYHHLPLLRRTWGERRFTRAELAAGAERFLGDRYHEVVREGARALAALLRVVADPDNHPVVFHCAVGKDRTGVAAAVVLGVLGVDDSEILDDYASSAPAMRRLERELARRDPGGWMAWTRQPAVFTAVAPDAISLVLDDLRRRHGSVVGWARSIGVELDVLESLHRHLLV